MMSNFVIIFAAGKGKRMHCSIPKQFMSINNKPILAYTIAKFDNLKEIKGIVLVVSRNQIKKAKSIIKNNKFKKVIKVIEGGNTALDSQYRGLEYLKNAIAKNDDLVIIHDGVRPLIDKNTIINAIELARKKGNAITISPANETISFNSFNKIKNIMPREKCSIVRAPQVFRLNDIYNAHIKINKNKNEFVDSASMMNYLGYKLNVIVGPVNNIKVTTEHDFILCDVLLKRGKYVK